jgi:hypothetical protein
MKKYLTVIVVIAVALAMAWVTFGQERGTGRGTGAGGAGRGGFMTPEEQQKVIEAIEQQVAKLKEGLKAQPRPEGFADLSEEEKTQLREKFTKAREVRQAAIGGILAQLARLQGRMQPPAEGEQFIIVNTADLKAVRELAVKEKAKETEDRLTAMIERPTRGFGGRGTGGARGEGTTPRTPRGAGATEKQP